MNRNFTPFSVSVAQIRGKCSTFPIFQFWSCTSCTSLLLSLATWRFTVSLRTCTLLSNDWYSIDKPFENLGTMYMWPNPIQLTNISYLITANVETELLHTYSRIDPYDTLILCVRLAVLTAVTLTVPIVLFPVSVPDRKFI